MMRQPDFKHLDGNDAFIYEGDWLQVDAVIDWLVESAKSADARHQTVKELANPSGGAFDTATVLRVFLGSGRGYKMLNSASRVQKSKSLCGFNELLISTKVQEESEGRLCNGS
jgi:hypothetical protein